ncbi:MAG: YihY/virulence factor BrkB family protein [Chloroflexi bacterium]|nr:YihY/virulence factor BrkB family protein [Chloroflexota bacterium]MCI0577442.1 YihY/virulence factor BrkB family protein [Chloroflexota bacterium]MCI0649710.1 YihY/virulence factor BrkB family protein [Chloroflexota bacterium]MCI0725440.1 YihY/virulence factor BrkB family protein [Chloroflexota bacterium]
MERLKMFFNLVKRTFKDWSEDKATRLAAALAYYTVFSIPPLLLIAIAVAGQVFGEEAAHNQISGQISGLIGPDGAQAVEEMIENARQPAGGLLATIAGVVVLLFGASGVFGQLQDAMNTIWEVMPKPGRGILGTIRARFFSFTMVLGVAFLLLVSLLISAALAALDEFVVGLLPGFEVVLQIVNGVVSLAVITFLFALIFKYVPDVKIAWSDVGIGAAITALLFTLGKIAIGLYLGNSAVSSTYGAAGSLVVILLWVYYSVQILFLGAEFTQVYANNYGSHIVADRGAIPLTEEARAQQGIPSEETEERRKEEAGRAWRDRVAPGPVVSAGPRPTATVRQAGRLEALENYTIAIVAVGMAIWRWLRGRRREEGV